MTVASRTEDFVAHNGSGPQEATLDPTKTAHLLAHDARNWLTVLQVYCDLLQTSGAVDERYRSWIDELSAAVTRGHRLVGSLLDCGLETASGTMAGAISDIATKGASTPQAGKSSREISLASESTPPWLDLASLLERRLPMLRRLAGPEIRVTLESAPHPGRVAMAEEDLDRILQNLVINAMEAMPQGGDLHIAISSLHREQPLAIPTHSSAVRLCISDTGTGIAPNLLSSIFETGVSSKKKLKPAAITRTAGRTGGPTSGHSDPLCDTPTEHRLGERGFGLAAVRELTLRAGGTVRVESQRGRGTRFEIEFPVALESDLQTSSGYRRLLPIERMDGSSGPQRSAGAGRRNNSVRTAAPVLAEHEATREPRRRKA